MKLAFIAKDRILEVEYYIRKYPYTACLTVGFPAYLLVITCLWKIQVKNSPMLKRFFLVLSIVLFTHLFTQHLVAPIF